MRKQILITVAVILLSSAASARPAKHKSLKINGQVLDDKGHPVAGAKVQAVSDRLRGRVLTSSSDRLGKFRIAVSQTGRFMLIAEKPAEGYPSSYNPFYHVSAEARPQVFVTEDGEPPFTTIRFAPKAGKVGGRIVDGKTGVPVEAVQVKLCRVEAPNYCYILSRKYPGGLFQFLVPASVPFQIHLSAAGYQDWSETAAVIVTSDTTKKINVSMEKLADKSSSLEMLRAPEVLFPADGTDFDYYPRTTRLEWSAVPGAVSYTLEVEWCLKEKVEEKECRVPRPFSPDNAPISGIKEFSYEFEFIGAQPGRWRVWAVDNQGRAGAKTKWTIFIYHR